jgi:hypothetical protein
MSGNQTCLARTNPRTCSAPLELERNKNVDSKLRTIDKISWLLCNLVPRAFPLVKKDPGRRWSRDLLKSSSFLINYLGFLYDNHTNVNYKFNYKNYPNFNIYWPHLGLPINHVTSVYKGLFSPRQEERPWVRGWPLWTLNGWFISYLALTLASNLTRCFGLCESKLLLIQTRFLKKYFQIYRQAVGKFASNFWLTQG